jgi:hypothetical protein
MATVKLLRTPGIRSLIVQGTEGPTELSRDEVCPVSPSWAVKRIQLHYLEFSFETKDKKEVEEALKGLPERILLRTASRLGCEEKSILTTLFPKPKSTASVLKAKVTPKPKVTPKKKA